MLFAFSSLENKSAKDGCDPSRQAGKYSDASNSDNVIVSVPASTEFSPAT